MLLPLVFRCIHGQAPDYLCALIQPAPMSKPGLRSESRDAFLRVSFTRHNGFAYRGFSVNGPNLWNSLPGKIRLLINDIGKFKRDLQTWLFDIF